MRFSDVYNIDAKLLDDYGAFNISFALEMPLFVDPFLLFCSENQIYIELHESIIQYLKFLRDISMRGVTDKGVLKAWFKFAEVKQNWLGFCTEGNSGRGLGMSFANALCNNLHDLFKDFGNETVTHGSHLEKLCLVNRGVGRDMISDFTTNMIKMFLLEYTQKFAQLHLREHDCAIFKVNKVQFDYERRYWQAKEYFLPRYDNDFVLLTPSDILTKDDTWINQNGLINEFNKIPAAIENDALRAQINEYFHLCLSSDSSKQETREATRATLVKFPELVDYYIKYKEENSEEAVSISEENVRFVKSLYSLQVTELRDQLKSTAFYDTKTATYERIMYLKDVIENKDGYRNFYYKGSPIHKEEILKAMLKLTFFASVLDTNIEANNGRGPSDFLVSYGSADKTLVEFKLACNKSLKRNLKNQTKIYQVASNAQKAYIVIVFFSESEEKRVKLILIELKRDQDDCIVLIDARSDNKPSASIATSV